MNGIVKYLNDQSMYGQSFYGQSFYGQSMYGKRCGGC
jgi:hypothetical protein